MPNLVPFPPPTRRPVLVDPLTLKLGNQLQVIAGCDPEWLRHLAVLVAWKCAECARPASGSR